MIAVKAGVSLRGEGARESTVLDAESYGRVILCRDAGEVRIEGLTVTRGRLAGPPGAGIYSIGTSMPAISNCIVSDNELLGEHGAGIYAERATIVDCEVFGNSIELGDGGVGIYIRGGAITRCTIRNNEAVWGSGGGVGIAAYQTDIIDCEVFDNSGGPGQWRGAAIAIGEGSISRCTIRNNRVYGDAFSGCGGISADNTSISDCWIEGNSVWNGYYGATGGGACVSGGSVTRCTFVGNVLERGNPSTGGGLYCADCSIIDCIIVGNAAADYPGLGGGIAAYGQVTITGCALVGNAGVSAPSFGTGIGGVFLEGAGSVGSVRNTIIASNVGLACSGPITFSCTNLYANTEGDSLCGTDGGGNFSADPQFCAENPAASLNFALQADSPCAPGHHPDGASCGLIGAAPVGCATVSVEATTWSRLKSLYR